MSYLIQVVAGLLPIWIVAKLLRVTVLRHVRPPIHWWSSPLLALVIGIPVAAWGNERGAGLEWNHAFASYVPPAIAWAMWYWWKGRREDAGRLAAAGSTQVPN